MRFTFSSAEVFYDGKLLLNLSNRHYQSNGNQVKIIKKFKSSMSGVVLERLITCETIKN